MRDLLRVHPDLIDVGERLREVDPAYVEVLRESIANIGLIQPIEVRETEGDRFLLVAGAHRLAAVKGLAAPMIEVVVVKASDLRAQLREIDENLIRHELKALDRAGFLARRKEVWEALYPETAKGKAGATKRWFGANDKMSFAYQAAEKAGLTPRTIQRDIGIWRNLTPETLARIRGTWLADHQAQLKALSALGGEIQARVLDALLRSENPASNVAAALAEATGQRKPERDEAEETAARLIRIWTHAPAKARKVFIDHLRSTGALEEFAPAPKTKPARKGEKKADAITEAEAA